MTIDRRTACVHRLTVARGEVDLALAAGDQGALEAAARELHAAWAYAHREGVEVLAGATDAERADDLRAEEGRHRQGGPFRRIAALVYRDVRMWQERVEDARLREHVGGGR